MKTERTFIERSISPLMTSVFSLAYQNRRLVAMGIRALSRKLDDSERSWLLVYLFKNGIIQPQNCLQDLRLIEHFHLKKTITTTKLTLAAYGFYQETGSNDFQMLIPQMIFKKAAQRMQYQKKAIDYSAQLDAVKPLILQGLSRGSAQEDEIVKAVIDDSIKLFLNLVHAFPVDCKRLSYRLRKIADIGGSLDAVLAELFMGIPPDNIRAQFNRSRNPDLIKLSEKVCDIIQRFQHVKSAFFLNTTRMKDEPKYINDKMQELARSADNPQVLKMYFIHKLEEARKPDKNRTDPIYREIRFFYAPMAERLGLSFLSNDFKDQLLKYSNAKTYNDILKMVSEKFRMDYNAIKFYLEAFAKELHGEIQNSLGEDAAGLEVKYRVKSPYSIWNKVFYRKKRKFKELTDILGVKFICTNSEQLKLVNDCLKRSGKYRTKKIDPSGVLGAPTRGNWRGINIIGEDSLGKQIEIQLVTEETERENTFGEEGADWKYNYVDKEFLIDDSQIFDIRQDFDFKKRSPHFEENFLWIKRGYSE